MGGGCCFGRGVMVVGGLGKAEGGAPGRGSDALHSLLMVVWMGGCVCVSGWLVSLSLLRGWRAWQKLLRRHLMHCTAY